MAETDPEQIPQIGPYPVRRFVAEGGMATIFEVVDPKFDAPRALKLLKPEFAGSESFRRFKDEARILAGLDHPNLLTIYDFGEDEATGRFYYTMTLVDSPPLSERTPLPLEQASPLLLGVLDGLAALHERGIVHRDIKPSNVLIDARGRPLLADLGIARVAPTEPDTTVLESRAPLTRAGTTLGTPRYMSPEQASGRPVDARSDIFSMGITIYEVLTGGSPYVDRWGADANDADALRFHLESAYREERELGISFAAPEIPSAVSAVIRRACRVQPEDRYPDAAALRTALAQALADPQERGRAPQPRPRWSHRVAAGLLLLLGVGAIALALLEWSGGIGGGSGEAQSGHAEATSGAATEATTPPRPPDPLERLAGFSGGWTEARAQVRTIPKEVPSGSSYSIAVEVDCRCHLLVFSIDPDREDVVLLYPNPYEPDRPSTPGEPLRLPSTSAYVFEASGPGEDLLKVLARERPFPFPAGGGAWSAAAADPERLGELEDLLAALDPSQVATAATHLRIAAPAEARADSLE